MSRRRHAEENRVVPGTTPTKERCLVELQRRRATRRKLVLLECGIIRHAPFADCGRSLWDLMPSLGWFETQLVAAEWVRHYYACREGLADPSEYPQWFQLSVNAHQAIDWFENYVDGSDNEDQLYNAEQFFKHAEYSAEGGRFETPDDRRDELEISYGAADWLDALTAIGPELWNVLDYYLANYSGEYYSWAGFRPLHPSHRGVAIQLIDDILGHPLGCKQFDPSWRTSNAVRFAESMYEFRDFSPIAILADMLEEAGCDNNDLLTHCRSEALHVRGCWALDLVMGNK